MTAFIICVALFCALMFALLWHDGHERRTATRINHPVLGSPGRDRLDASRGIERTVYLYALCPDYAGYEHVQVEVVADVHGGAHGTVRTMDGSYLWTVRGTADPAAILSARGYVTVTPR